MAKRKANKLSELLKTKVGMIVCISLAAIILFVCAFIIPSGIVAASKQKAYVEEYGDSSITDLPGPGVAWTYICMKYSIISGYDDVKITKGTHYAYGASYNYLKYTFKLEGKKYVCYYHIDESVEYEVK